MFPKRQAPSSPLPSAVSLAGTWGGSAGMRQCTGSGNDGGHHTVHWAAQKAQGCDGATWRRRRDPDRARAWRCRSRRDTVRGRRPASDEPVQAEQREHQGAAGSLHHVLRGERPAVPGRYAVPGAGGHSQRGQPPDAPDVRRQVPIRDWVIQDARMMPLDEVMRATDSSARGRSFRQNDLDATQILVGQLHHGSSVATSPERRAAHRFGLRNVMPHVRPVRQWIH